MLRRLIESKMGDDYKITLTEIGIALIFLYVHSQFMKIIMKHHNYI